MTSIEAASHLSKPKMSVSAKKQKLTKIEENDFDGLIDETEFKNFHILTNEQLMSNKIDASKCDNCEIKMEIEDRIYVCPECGLSKDITEEEDVIYTNSNNNSDATSTLRIVGKLAKDFQRHHIQMTSDYSKKKKIDSQTEFEKHFHKYKIIEKETGQFAPPWYVFDKASELFNVVQQKYTKRSTKRRGVQGACIFYEARRAGMAKEEKLIAQIVGVSETSLHNGMDLLENMHREGLIDIPLISVDDDEMSRITQYCNQLDIDLKYVPFIYDFVERAIDSHVGDESESKSKCVGTIYFLAKLKGIATVLENIKKCDISKPTYHRFFREVCQKHKKFKDLYTKYEKILGVSYKHAAKKLKGV